MSKVEYDDRVLLDSVCVKKGKEITPTDKTMLHLVVHPGVIGHYQ